jgi:hydroxyacylglutathione hydrolase
VAGRKPQMVFKQFYLGCLAHASYLIGDETTREAVVVDPQRDVDQYVAFAAEHDLQIAHVVLTHLHADFVAGHLELRDKLGATIYLGKAAQAEYAFVPLGDGDAIDMGGVRLEAMETPGHTAESISLLVIDAGQHRSRPVAVLTGDTLFVGDVGRPDLRVALGWSARDLGGRLCDSLHGKLLTLPDDVAVYPAHGAGSLCGKALSKDTSSTIGKERETNYALKPMSREAFIDLVTTDQPDAPAYFTYDAVLNSRERSTLDEALDHVLPLSLDALLTLQGAGAQVLDTRSHTEFAAAHLSGSINVGLDGQYATWAGVVLDHTRPIAIVADPGREHEAAVRLGRIGFDNIAGYLKDGLRSLEARPDLVVATERISPGVAAQRAEAGPDGPVIVDVRAPAERERSRIAGSIGIPLTRLAEHLDELPTDQPLIVHCAGGYRSSVAVSLLAQRGFTRLSEIAGGMTAWEAAGLPREGS